MTGRRPLLRLVRDGTFCVSCIAETLAVTKLDVMTELSAISGVLAINFTTGPCAQCHESKAIVRPG